MSDGETVIPDEDEDLSGRKSYSLVDMDLKVTSHAAARFHFCGSLLRASLR